MSYKGVWAAKADKVLEGLFKLGQPAPTRKQLIDAYPFGAREYWPYKAWLQRVKAWKTAHAKSLPTPPSPLAARRAAEEAVAKVQVELLQ